MRDEEQINSGDLDAGWENDLDVEIVDLETLDDTDEDGQKPHIPSWSAPVLQWQHSFTRRRWRTLATTCSNNTGMSSTCFESTYNADTPDNCT